MLDDLRYALRQLRRSPGFAVVAVVTLALGIGANTTIFSVLRGILLRPLPYAEPDRSVMISSHLNGKDNQWVSPAEFADYQAQSSLFSSVAIFDEGAFTLAGDHDAESLRGGLVSANLFATVGTAPILGRVFTAEEDQAGGPRLVVIGEGIWRRRYSGDAAIIGKPIQIDAQPYTVVGVMPEAFRLPIDFAVTAPTQFWVPLQLPSITADDRGNHSYYVTARLRPGLEIEAARPQFARFVAAMKQKHPDYYRPTFDVSLATLREQVVGRVRPALLLLLGAVGLVLLMACGNIANLLLARGESRQKELAIRAAMGASRGRLIRQLLLESVLLSVIGGGAGLLIAWWGISAIPAINPTSLPRVESIGLDPAVLAATFVLSLITGVVFGLAPAWQMARPALQAELKETGRGVTATRRGRGFRSALIGGEVALAVVLVIGAGLLVQSYMRLTQLSPGFKADNVLTMRLALPEASYPTRASVTSAFDRVIARLGQLPGVLVAGGVTGLPLATIRGDWGVIIEGQVARDRRDLPQVDWQVIEPGYFEALSIPLVAGRYPTAADRSGSLSVIVVNEAMARQHWPEGHAVGQRMRLTTPADSNWRTVIGVAGNVHHRALDAAPRPEMFVPLDQFFETAPDDAVNVRGLTLTLKTASDPLALVASARQVVASIDPTLAMSDIRTMQGVVSSSIATPRFTAVLLGVFAALALALAAVGIYGLVSFAVAQRTGEMGIRLALGAEAADILKLVVGQGMRPVIAGLTAGLVASLLLARVLTAMLTGISARDLSTYAVVIGVLGGVGLLACWLPARRASRTDPIVAMRND
ncbi:MAG: ABC transporter permease [Gemmatimonadota bacterium]